MSGVHDDLATLRRAGWLSPDESAALDRVEAEIARLEEDRDSWVRSADLAVQTWEAREAKQHARAEAAEARCARLQQALRPFIPTGKPRIEYIGRFTCVSVRVNLDEFERAAEALAGLDTPAGWYDPARQIHYDAHGNVLDTPADSQEAKT